MDSYLVVRLQPIQIVIWHNGWVFFFSFFIQLPLKNELWCWSCGRKRRIKYDRVMVSCVLLFFTVFLFVLHLYLWMAWLEQWVLRLTKAWKSMFNLKTGKQILDKYVCLMQQLGWSSAPACLHEIAIHSGLLEYYNSLDLRPVSLLPITGY